jgi:hypothetical protein
MAEFGSGTFNPPTMAFAACLSAENTRRDLELQAYQEAVKAEAARIEAE